MESGRVYAPPGEHEELHQDLLIALWHAIPSYREEAKPSTFIYRVALNGAFSWHRSRTRYQRRHVELEEVAAPPILEGHAAEQQARVERLYEALARLSVAERSLALMHLDGQSYREIAEVLGIKEGYVGVKLTRIRTRLAELLRSMEREGIGRE